MGLCTSCEATSVATSKLILQNGNLQEFSYPVKSSYLLSKDPSFFICHSDDIDFDGVVSPLPENADLEPGQLYFALPRTKLCRPLLAEEMAALAVKANTALLNSRADDKCGCRKKTGFFRGDQRDERSSAKVADVGSAAGNKMKSIGNSNRSRRDGRRKAFVANLNVIPE